MRRTTALLVVLVAVAAAALAVANRKIVSFSLDPFSDTQPALSFDMPLYLLLLIALAAGILLGALTVTLNRIRWPERKPPAPTPDEGHARAIQLIEAEKREAGE